MANLPFSKMHGCGNDYIYVDGMSHQLPTELPALARAVSDRHYGIGSDGLIALLPSETSDIRMRMYNADGSESEMCGNGIRCLARFAKDQGHAVPDCMRVETGAGEKVVTLSPGKQGAWSRACVDMGAPLLQPEAVPVRHQGPGPRLDCGIACPLIGNQTFHAVGMGNPHAVCFIAGVEQLELTEIGPFVEHNERFPNRTNVEFVELLPAENGVPILRQRTWERGSGETLACGTGACATLVAAILTKRIAGREAIVRLSGGDLHIEWPNDDAAVMMTGEAIQICSGEWPVAN